MESNTPQKQPQPQSSQDSSPQTEIMDHIADNPVLKRLNAVWNQDQAGQAFVMPYRRPKGETKSS